MERSWSEIAKAAVTIILSLVSCDALEHLLSCRLLQADIDLVVEHFTAMTNW